MKEVYEFIKKCGAYFLATVDGDQPRVRPFGTILEYEGKLYIQTGRAKDVSKQMAANPRVELCAFDGDKNWLRVQATVVDDDRVEPKEAMLEAYPGLRGRYSATDENMQVLYLKDAVATFCSFDGPSRTVKF